MRTEEEVAEDEMGEKEAWRGGQRRREGRSAKGRERRRGCG